MENQKTLLEVVDDLKKAGYDNDFEYHADHIHAIQGNKKFNVDEFKVDQGFQFACTTSGDCSAVYAITPNNENLKGVLVDYYDSMRELDDKIAEKFKANEKQVVADESRVETRYGLRKVFKDDFNQDPDRYELRKGFPDVPKCPYGQTFKMLGYDKKDHDYVWFVTSILKDDRLKEVDYKG